MALKVSNKNRKKEKVIVVDPFVSSSFKKEVVVEEEIVEGVQYDPTSGVILNYEVREDEHPDLYKQMRKQNDDISITIFWISVIVVSIIGLLL